MLVAAACFGGLVKLHHLVGGVLQLHHVDDLLQHEKGQRYLCQQDQMRSRQGELAKRARITVATAGEAGALHGQIRSAKATHLKYKAYSSTKNASLKSTSVNSANGNV